MRWPAARVILGDVNWGRRLAEATLVQNASPGGTAPLREFIGDEPVATFSC